MFKLVNQDRVIIDLLKRMYLIAGIKDRILEEKTLAKDMLKNGKNILK